ncbi:four helix bundle protein [Planktothrix sp. FACHB-1365]|uniref:four helix bundle protein n=1 Tax=Planktothrix sp. FACHB-1365 TaxID=2692855 RepID=UPI001682465E|nr:four helix bundle protein [Planktothrix sp. FACHB-1365]MBD2482586.1 four helix bundle protein [Planktothrix sp. FACHB-1365]
MGEDRKKIIRTPEDLEVYQLSFQGAMQIFKASQRFPIEERYSLTDQIRRSSRSVCANLAEAWRKRRYEAAFIAKLNDSEAEASETQVWIKFAVQCGYLDAHTGQELYTTYDKILGSLVNMINHPKSWLIKP